jgi:hypothetical protein
VRAHSQPEQASALRCCCCPVLTGGPVICAARSRGAGQLTLRASTNERLQLAAMGFVPIFCSLLGRVRGGRD